MARLKNWFSIFFVFALGALASINQFIAPYRSNSFDLSEESYRPSVATAQAAELHRESSGDSIDAAPIAASNTVDETRSASETEKMIDRLDNAEIALLGETAAKRADDERLEAALESNRTLQAQQESLIQEISRLRKLAEQPSGSANAASAGPAVQAEVARLKAELLESSAKADKDRANVKLLADHILKLRENLKAAQEELAKKTSEIEELSHSSDLTSKLSIEKERLNAEKSRIAEELSSVKSENAALKSATDVAAKLNKELSAEKARLTAELESLKKQGETTSGQLGEEKNHAANLEAALRQLREKIAQGESDKKAVDARIAAKDQEYRLQSDELEETKRQLSRTISEVSTCSANLTQREKAAAGLPELEKKLLDMKTALTARETDIKTLRSKLQEKEEIVNGIPGMKKELLALRNQVLMKDRELKLLNGGTAPSAVEISPAPKVEDQAQRDRILEQSGRIAGKEAIEGKAAPAMSDVLVVEVLGDRVALRSGPSPDDSEVVSVSKGNRLTVEERIGDWYRVIAPNSARAYVRADMVKVFSGGESVKPPMMRRPGAQAKAPKKRALQAVPSENMEPFGNVNGSGDKVDRAFRKLQSGVDNGKPMPPEMIP